jgi:protein-S-isoprenylcysteine O-methyltransferase Ste14
MNLQNLFGSGLVQMPRNKSMFGYGKTGVDSLSVAWLNLISLHVSAFLFAYLTTLSVMPMTREEKRGEKAWEECARLRSISFVFAGIMILNTILWIWFPVPEIAWVLSPDPLFGIIIGLIIAVPCFIILMIAMRDAGKEMHAPQKGIQLHGGIYKRIRHPGAVGEMPLYVVIALFVNSLFLSVWMIVFVFVFTPIHIYYEEKDLLKRFGEVYVEYRRTTPAVFPGFKRRRSEER